jgi:hypothetical protein
MFSGPAIKNRSFLLEEDFMFRVQRALFLFATFLALFFLSLTPTVAQTGIQSVQAAFDPQSGQPQNLKILVLTNTILASPADISLKLNALSSGGGTPTNVPSPPAKAVPSNPTAAFFLVPLASLAQADILSYQATLTAGASVQTAPEMQISLEPLAALQQIENQNTSLTANIAALTTQLTLYQQAAKNALADTPVFVAQRFRGTDLLFQLSTDRPALLHARLLKMDDSLIEEHTETMASAPHLFTFSNVLPGTGYYMTSTVVDPVTMKDVANTTLSGKADPRLQGQMTSPPSQPTISNLALTQGNSSSFGFSFSVDRPAVIQIMCYHLAIPNVLSSRELVSTPVSATKDIFGVASGTSVSGKQTGQCKGLQPEQTYIAEITAVDAFGQTQATAADLQAQTTKKLDFDGPISVTFSTKGMTVDWKATSSGATAKLEIGGIQGIPSLPVPLPSSNGNSYTTTISVANLATAFGVNPTKTPPTTMPVFTASMQDATGTETASLSFTVSVTVPKSTSSAQQVANPGDAQSLNSLDNVVSGIQSPNKKFTWQDLLQTGVGAVIKLI